MRKGLFAGEIDAIPQFVFEKNAITF